MKNCAASRFRFASRIWNCASEPTERPPPKAFNATTPATARHSPWLRPGAALAEALGRVGVKGGRVTATKLKKWAPSAKEVRPRLKTTSKSIEILSRPFKAFHGMLCARKEPSKASTGQCS